MLGAASHEFRNPLSGLSSMLNLLDDVVPESHQEFLTVAKSSTDLCLFLSNDLLDYAQIEAGRLKVVYDEFNVFNTCMSLVKLLRYKAENKGI